jgi:hypothetical protein
MDEISEDTLDHLARHAEMRAIDAPARGPDQIERVVRIISRFAGYASLGVAVIGIVYLAVR